MIGTYHGYVPMRITEGMILAATPGNRVEVPTSLVIQVDWMGAAAGRELVSTIIAHVCRFLETLVACGFGEFALSENRHE